MTRLATRALLTCAAIGAAGGLLILPVTLLLGPAALSAVLLWGAVQGVWYLPGALAQRLLRLPGVGLLTTLIMSLTLAVATGGYAGVLTTAAIGVILEIPFLVTRYRRWHPVLFVIAGVVAGGINAATFSLVVNGWTGFPGWMPVVYPVVTVLGVVGFILLGVGIADRLHAAGVGRRRGRVAASASASGPSAPASDAAAPDTAETAG